MVRPTESNKVELISILLRELNHASLGLVHSVVVVTTPVNPAKLSEYLVLQQSYALSSTQVEPLAFDYATRFVADPMAEHYEHRSDSIAVGS
jgi:hypothetical protein